jgi:hypothetical protein
MLGGRAALQGHVKNRKKKLSLAPQASGQRSAFSTDNVVERRRLKLRLALGNHHGELPLLFSCGGNGYFHVLAQRGEEINEPAD